MTQRQNHLIFFVYFWAINLFAQSNIDPSALLEIDSTTKGFLLPRLTTTQRDAITSPAEGLMIYNATTEKINLYSSSSGNWEEMSVIVVNPSVASIASSFTFDKNFMEGSPAHGEVEVKLTNNSLSTLNLSFTTGDITLSGVNGVSISAVSDSVEDIAPGDSYTISYTLSGTVGDSGTLKAVYLFNNLTSSATKMVDTNTIIAHNSLVYKTVLSSTGQIWLDRNLGASQVATGAFDFKAYGNLYQWGRSTDGHEEITYTGTNAATHNGTTTTKSDTPGHDDFIVVTANPRDWRSTTNNNLWNGVSAVNNPCPSGFRLPTETELNNELNSWSAATIYGAYASALKLPLAPFRPVATGVINFSGAYYWVSDVGNAEIARRLYISTGGAAFSGSYRGDAFPVRCIKD